MKAKRVVVTDFNFGDMDIEEKAVATAGCALIKNQCSSAAEVVAALSGADVAFVQQAPVNADAIAGMNSGATMVRYGAGYDNVDLEACKEHGVALANVPDYGTEEVAVHALAMLLGLVRRIGRLDESVRQGQWDAVSICGALPSASSMTLGLYGLGRIGQALAERAVPLGMTCIAYDPYANQNALPAGIELVDLDSLWARSDALSLHAPLSDETKHAVSAASLAKCKPSVLLVNCARGELVDSEALGKALCSGQVGGAALDVFAIEPLPVDASIRNAPNLILTPHAAWCSGQSMQRLRELAAEEAVRAIKGESLRCPVV